MALYALGRDAALATIKAAVAERTTTLSDGSRSVDLASLAQWVDDQGRAIVAADVPAARKAAATAVLSTIDARQDVANIAHYIGRENWKARADWPTTASASASPAFISAVAAAMADMEQAVRALEAVYENISDGVAAVTDAAADELALEAKLPPTVRREFEARFYVSTHVTDWGEESSNSPISVRLDLDQNDHATLQLGTVPAGRGITRRRIYRSNAGTVDGGFQFVCELPATSTSYLDNRRHDELGELLATVNWAPPPANLRGLTSMPNGVMAGFFDNTVCFCEPFAPYAWPVKYQLTTQLPIVALGAFGQTLVVAHHGGVDYISGADAASMAAQKDVSVQACAAPRSMVAVEGGVVYASPDGLCLATGAGVRVITQDHFTREDWTALLPATVVGAYHERSYYFFCGPEGARRCYALHLDSARLTTLDLQGSAFFTDLLTDTLYVARANRAHACFASSARRSAVWRSKVVVLPQQAGFSWLSVESDFSAPVVVRWYGDGVLRHTATVTSRAPVRLPPGRYLEHEVEVESQARWNSLALASSTTELQAA